MPSDHPADDLGASPAPIPDGRPVRLVRGAGAEPDWALVARVLAGEGTPAERAAVARWADADPARRAELDAVRRWWEAAATLPTPARVDAMWHGVAARLREPAEAQGTGGAATAGARDAAGGARVLRFSRRAAPPGARAQAAWRRRVAALAAAAVVAFGASGLAWRGLGLGTAPEVRDRTEAPVREFATRRGQQAAVTLADGSRVTLGPDTRMRVHTSAAAREVELTGEAVFDVRHDAARPFVVRAAHAVTEDLGTTFGVRAYPGDSVVRVVVTEGAVALRAVAAPAATGAQLGPGDVARLDRAGLARVDAGGAEAYLAWTRGRVAFRNAVLSEVAAELERRYDVAIRFARPTDAQRRITVDMPAGTLAEVLDAVTVPLRLGYRRDGGVIVVDRAALGALRTRRTARPGRSASVAPRGPRPIGCRARVDVSRCLAVPESRAGAWRHRPGPNGAERRRALSPSL